MYRNCRVTASALLQVVFAMLILYSPGLSAEVFEIQLGDGQVTKGKLHLPRNVDDVRTIVVYVHGTGPNTYENPRLVGGKSFKFYDMLSEEFVRRGIAAFAFNRRGVEIGTEPPNFDKIDREKYRAGVPSVEVSDFRTILAALRKRPELERANFVLLGFSEGTMIASLVAEHKENRIAALLLAGYAHENLYDIIKWQYSGASSMINLRPPFDANKDGDISREEFESQAKLPTAWREKVMQGVEFGVLDKNKDEALTAEDFRITVEPMYKMILTKIKDNDEDWIWKNYFRVSIPWLNEHFKLEPNKERLPRLDMPIFVFHGDRDANVDVAGVYDLEKRFEKAGKTNLKAYIFKDHDHQLKIFDWILKDEMSEGYRKLFEVASKLNDQFAATGTSEAR